MIKIGAFKRYGEYEPAYFHILDNGKGWLITYSRYHPSSQPLLCMTYDKERDNCPTAKDCLEKYIKFLETYYKAD